MTPEERNSILDKVGRSVAENIKWFAIHDQWSDEDILTLDMQLDDGAIYQAVVAPSQHLVGCVELVVRCRADLDPGEGWGPTETTPRTA